ncbi:MAG TPA: Gfo/Idh/MocA family oxidoreductase, partial [Gammaproteobacteria bacterium]
TTSQFRWGILGTGWIAGDFAAALMTMPEAIVHAVGSRSQGGAEAFADKFGIPNRYGSYEALVADEAIDIVHVATPHPFHCEHVLLALQHGKAVLCEKPFTLNAAEAKRVIDYARFRGIFLMEALWGRFVPGQVKLRELLAQNAIGSVQSLIAGFASKKEYDPANRYFNPALGGGALLDVGVYPLNLASMVLGVPSEVHGFAHIGRTGVDEYMGALLKYANGGIASIHASIVTRSPREALITGSEGYIKVHSTLSNPPAVTLGRHGEDEQVFHTAYEGWGFVFEATEVMRCLRKGLTESPVMPLDETLQIMQTMDTLRAQWRLTYPGEKSAFDLP